MADTIYTSNLESPEKIAGFEQYQSQDKNIITSFQVDSLFDPVNNFVELHILDLSDSLLESNYKYNRYSLLGNAQSTDNKGASVLTIDPIEDSLFYGFSFGGVKLLYHFLNDLYTTDNTISDFYIDSISADRTEVSLLTHNITPEDLVNFTDSIKTKLKSQSYFNEFRLDFKNNNLLIGVNIDTLDTSNGKSVVIKLYEPLPATFSVKSTLNIVEVLSDSVAYEIDYELQDTATTFTPLRSANFNIEVQDQAVVPSNYFNYNELLSYNTSNSNSEIYSMINEKGVELSIDYTDYSNFIHFSSAQERLLNFKYKIDLLNSYSQSLDKISKATGTTSGSTSYYSNLYQGIVNNFDHYERFLYYESGSSSWPKVNNTKPYVNQTSTQALDWFNSALTNSVNYDSSNYSALIDTIPSYLREDINNENYLTFIYMVGQHFDNLWIYSKAVTDRYDGDNRINHGISKDLVAEALKSFGVKLYTSNKSIEDLFTTFIGQAYQSGSEIIKHYITGSLTGSNTPIQPIAYDDYQKEIQKRIYHNLPLLLKSKGTERGLRALINCFGIPSDILDIKLYGGKNTYNLPLFGDSQYVTSSLDKIRLDNTGNIVSGNTLSNYTSIIKRDDRYTDDIHVIEVGFSPTDNVDSYIVSHSAATFSIDDYLGDPRNLYLHTYSGLHNTATTLLSSSLGTSGSYDLRDYVRLIKFFDNTVFKMIKDFIPARSVADTGIIIKPNILNISKAKSVRVSGSRPEYTGSISTAFISSKNASTFNFQENEYGTSYNEPIQTPTGILIEDRLHGQEQAKYNGELLGSFIVASSRDLNKANPYKVVSYIENNYDIYFVSASTQVCNLSALSTITTPVYINPTVVYNPADFFDYADTRTSYSASLTVSPTNYIGINLANGYQFNTGLTQYQDFLIKADNWDYSLGSCTVTVPARYGICALQAKALSTNSVVQYSTSRNNTYDLTTWFDSDINQSGLQYTASYNGTTGSGIPNSGSYKFTQNIGTSVTIIVVDPKLGPSCTAQQTVYVNSCTLGKLSSSDWASLTNVPETRFIEFKYSYWEYKQINFVNRGVFTPNYLGRNTYSITANPLTNNSILTSWGIQGYFTPQTSVDLYESNLLRYNIYELTVNSNLTYNLGTVRKLVDSTATAALACCKLNQEAVYSTGTLISVGTCDTYVQKSSVNYTTKEPITIEVPSRTTKPIVTTKTLAVGQSIHGATPISATTVSDPIDIDQFKLPQAYIIEATNNNPNNLCSTQVTIYGQAAYIYKVEGSGNYVYWTAPINSYHTPGDEGGWLLADWDYSTNTVPFPGYPNIPSGYDGPWVYVKLRRFSQNPVI